MTPTPTTTRIATEMPTIADSPRALKPAIAAMTRTYGGATYVFAVALRDGAAVAQEHVSSQ